MFHESDLLVGQTVLLTGRRVVTVRLDDGMSDDFKFRPIEAERLGRALLAAASAVRARRPMRVA